MTAFDNALPTTPRQILLAARKLLGVEGVAEIFGVKDKTTVYKWSSDPRYCAEHRVDPVTRMQELVGCLCGIEQQDIAIALGRILFDGLDVEVIDRRAIAPDQPTLKDELLDDLQYENAFRQAMLKEKPPIEVRHVLDALIDELEQDYVRYVEQTIIRSHK